MSFLYCFDLFPLIFRFHVIERLTAINKFNEIQILVRGSDGDMTSYLRASSSASARKTTFRRVSFLKSLPTSSLTRQHTLDSTFHVFYAHEDAVATSIHPPSTRKSVVHLLALPLSNLRRVDSIYIPRTKRADAFPVSERRSRMRLP